MIRERRQQLKVVVKEWRQQAEGLVKERRQRAEVRFQGVERADRCEGHECRCSGTAVAVFIRTVSEAHGILSRSAALAPQQWRVCTVAAGDYMRAHAKISIQTF